jgi:hypothetical protein
MHAELSHLRYSNLAFNIHMMFARLQERSFRSSRALLFSSGRFEFFLARDLLLFLIVLSVSC